MAEHVEHTRPPREAGDEGVVRPLVVEEPRLLPARQVGEVGRVVHRHRHRRVEPAAQPAILRAQPLRRPRPSARAEQDVPAAHRLQRVREGLGPRVRPGGVGLEHRRLAEAVDDDAGQTVRLRVDEAVERRVVEPRAQGLRGAQPRRDPGAVDARVRVAVEHPSGDPGAGVGGHHPQRQARRVLEHGDRPGGHRAGAAVGDDVVEMDPGRPVADAAGVGLRLQA